MSVLGDLSDVCSIYQASSGDFGRASSLTLAGSATGVAQIMSFEESRLYSTESEREVYKILFASDPSIAARNWLKVVSASLGKTFWVRVLATSTQGNPKGTKRIWRVVGQEEVAPTVA